MALFVHHTGCFFSIRAFAPVYVQVKNKGLQELLKKTPDPGYLRALPGAGEMIYPEPVAGSVCQCTDPVSGFCGNNVHHENKYRFKWLFVENNDFNRDLCLLFSGLLRALFLPRIL